jgi:ADP-ribosylation factor related protein 1
MSFIPINILLPLVF